LKRILITGPESTGKSQLAETLASFFKGMYIPEYARSYLDGLGRPYEYSDVEHIGLQQVREYEQADQSQEWVFFDTWLIITRTWFQVVYNRIPEWVDKEISQASFDLVLLCAPDILWIPDPLRENGGMMRERLFELYKAELNRHQMNWKLVTGAGEERIHVAVQLIYNIL
jgi:nicotinamide riboside kinase